MNWRHFKYSWRSIDIWLRVYGRLNSFIERQKVNFVRAAASHVLFCPIHGRLHHRVNWSQLKCQLKSQIPIPLYKNVWAMYIWHFILGLMSFQSQGCYALNIFKGSELICVAWTRMRGRYLIKKSTSYAPFALLHDLNTPDTRTWYCFCLRCGASMYLPDDLTNDFIIR